MKSNVKILLAILFCFAVFAVITSTGVYAEKTDKWKKAPGIEKFPDAEAIILFDHISYDFNKDSSVVLTESEAVKLLTKDSFKKFQKITRSFIRPDQNIEVPVARIIRPDGEIINLDKTKEIIIEYPFGEKMPLHKDVGIITVDFSRAQEGDIIEFKLVNTCKKPMVEGQFWGLSFTMDEVPLIYTEFIVNIKKPGVKLHYYAAKTDGKDSKPVITKKDGNEIYTWTMKDRPAVKLEQGSTPFRSNVSFVMVSTFPSWEAMSADFSKVFEPYLTPGPEVKKKVEELVGEKKDTFEIINALAAYVNEKKMIDIPFNADNNEFFKPDDILKNENMTGNDGQMLFISMLQAAGIKAYPALLSDQSHGVVYKEVASPYQFNRLVTALDINGEWKYVDVTDSISKSLNLQTGKQGCNILVLNPGGSKLAITPVSSPETNLESIDVSAELSADGSLGARMTLMEKGTKKAVWQSLMAMLRQPQQRNMIFGRLVQVISPNARLLGAEILEKDEDDSVQFDITFMSEEYPMTSGKYWIVKVPMLPAPKKAPFMEQEAEDRKLPVMMGSLGMEKKTFVLKIPENCKVVSLPASVDVSNSVGSLKLDCTSEGNTINYNFVFEVKTMQVNPSQFDDLKVLYEKASKCSEEVILLEMPDKGSGSKVSRN